MLSFKLQCVKLSGLPYIGASNKSCLWKQVKSPASTFTHCSQPQRTVFSLIANGMDIQHCLCSPLHLLLNHLVLRRVLGLTACVAYPAGLWSSSVASSSDLSSKVEAVIIIDGTEDQHTGC